MTDFVRKFTSVNAMRFDGTRDCALAIAAAFPWKVARSVEHDDVLLVVGRHLLSEARAGDWITEDNVSGHAQVWSDADFKLFHKGFGT